MLSEDDLIHLRRAIRLAGLAREHGNHPFGALLVGASGEVLAEAENTVVTGRDLTAHAELNLVRRVAWRLDGEALARSTLYASTEPCAMCAAAIRGSGIGRVVYGLPQERLRQLTAGESPGDSPGDSPGRSPKPACREVFAGWARPIEVAGPALEAEAEEVHRGFWQTEGH